MISGHNIYPAPHIFAKAQKFSIMASTITMVPEEVILIASSDTANGASNKSADGSYFEVQLDEALEIPKDAINTKVAVLDATIWWTVPNILTGVNDNMYIYGPAAEAVETRTDLGYDPVAKFEISGDFLDITSVFGVDPPMPTGLWVVGDVFLVLSGNLAGSRYTITSIISDTTSLQSYTITPNTDSQADGPNDFARVREGTPAVWHIVIPQGLYDRAGLNTTVARLLGEAGALSDPDALVIFSGDEATQKTLTTFTWPTVYIDFTQPATPREILGYDSAVYGPYPTAPIDVLAPNVAQFNQVNYFLAHSDLVDRGLRFNNAYNQTVARVNITVTPGSQIVYAPFNPTVCNAQALAGGKRTNLRFWLTNDRQQRVNTNGENWSLTIRISFMRPFEIRPPRSDAGGRGWF